MFLYKKTMSQNSYSKIKAVINRNYPLIVQPLSLQIHVCGPQRCWRLTSRCDICERSRHIHAFGGCRWKCCDQEALPPKCREPSCFLHQGSHRTSTRGCRGPGGSVHCFGLLPQGPAPNPQPGPHWARVRPELCSLLSTAVEGPGPTGGPHKLIWIWWHQRLIVSCQHLSSLECHWVNIFQ